MMYSPIVENLGLQIGTIAELEPLVVNTSSENSRESWISNNKTINLFRRLDCWAYQNKLCQRKFSQKISPYAPPTGLGGLLGGR